ncbi:chitin synthase [Batrachochytrium dendrobatidis JEL423]|nr:chitin synthase [Batrachochytrium dendrobatidis JEL423]
MVNIPPMSKLQTTSHSHANAFASNDYNGANGRQFNAASQPSQPCQRMPAAPAAPSAPSDTSSYNPQPARPQQPAVPPISNYGQSRSPPFPPSTHINTQPPPMAFLPQSYQNAPKTTDPWLSKKVFAYNPSKPSHPNSNLSAQSSQIRSQNSHYVAHPHNNSSLLRRGRNHDLHNKVYGKEDATYRQERVNNNYRQRVHPWRYMSILCTCCIPSCILSCCGMPNSLIRQAFREKLTLCIVIMVTMVIVAFLAIGMPLVICPNTPRFDYTKLALSTNYFSVRGSAYELVPGRYHKNLTPNMSPPVENGEMVGNDLSFLFPTRPEHSACSRLLGPSYKRFKCVLPATWPNPSSGKYSEACHEQPAYYGKYMSLTKYIGEIFVDFSTIKKGNNLLVYSNTVLDIDRLDENPFFLGQKFYKLVKANVGQDATRAFLNGGYKKQAECLQEIFKVATVDSTPVGCDVSFFIIYAGFFSTVSIVLVKFFVALYFAAAVGWRMGNNPREGSARAIAAKTSQGKTSAQTQVGATGNQKGNGKSESSNLYRNNSTKLYTDPDVIVRASIESNDNRMEANIIGPSINNEPSLLRSLILVPCFSESKTSLTNTLDSIVTTDYPVSHKTILVVADGMVKGAGNQKMTHEYLIDMMEIDRRFLHEVDRNGKPNAYSYVSIGEGKKRKNYARVYAGWYAHSSLRAKPDPKRRDNQQPMPKNQEMLSKRVPIILIIKVGTEEERLPQNMLLKPGCRGKRDSQVLLMSFLSTVISNGRMTELEFELFYKLWKITGVHPANYEVVLMIDADTSIAPNSITRLVSCMTADSRIIAACGETTISNKFESWITMIQVYEYYISHHYSKAFESALGSVTCLPGCFSMYRITVPSATGVNIPILAHTSLIDYYSENVVDTLHKKNLLLLGEDRYLTCLLLKLFPRRSLVYTPLAVCQTTVPTTFKVLLSQRRRWINSTVHNLLELLMVNTLCGTLCLSMQGIIFLELIGTVVMPVAVLLLVYVIVLSIVTKATSLIAILFIVSMICLPPTLVLITSRRIEQFFWFALYMAALPLWQFVLPLYAFWHFDDFTWGSTRQLHDHRESMYKEKNAAGPGRFDANGIKELRWKDWVIIRQQGQRPAMLQNGPPAGYRNGAQGHFPDQIRNVSPLNRNNSNNRGMHPS